MRKVAYAAGAAAILAHFLFFARESVHSHFAPDEMMNMGWAWDTGLPRILQQIVTFWKMSYRPTGALYYWTFHRLFHLDPWPFRYFDFALLIFNIWLFYRFARVLKLTRPAAFVATFLFSYHEGIMLWAAYNGAWAYDRLCFTFSIAMLLVYFRRTDHSRLAVAALFVLALGAKEMAVVLPGILIVHEALHWRDSTKARAAFLVGLCAMSVAYAWGRTHGPEALASKPNYILKAPTVGNYVDSQARHMKDYFFQEQPWSRATAGAILLALALAAALLRSRELAFATAFILIAPLPIAFVDRGGGALYIPYVGWCLYAAELLRQLSERVSRFVRPAWTFWPAAAALAYLLITYNHFYWIYDKPAMLANGDLTWKVITDLNRLRPPIRPGAKIYVEKSPFDTWDMVFIVMLWADVRPIDVLLVGKNAPDGLATPGLTGILSLDDKGHVTWRTP